MERKTPLALKHFTDHFPTDHTDGIKHGAGIDPITGDRIAPHFDAKIGQIASAIIGYDGLWLTRNRPPANPVIF